MKARLKKDESQSVALSYSGRKELKVRHNILYDFIYDSEDNFFLIVEDVLYQEVSTAFDFV